MFTNGSLPATVNVYNSYSRSIHVLLNFLLPTHDVQFTYVNSPVLYSVQQLQTTELSVIQLLTSCFWPDVCLFFSTVSCAGVRYLESGTAEVATAANY
jgi:hypothetical protein